MRLRNSLILSSALMLAACSPDSCDEGLCGSSGWQANLERNATNKVYFKTDIPRPGKLGLDCTQQEMARSVAKWLHNNKDVNVIIEGHCDERGTREYNLALGERRATALKSAIVEQYQKMYNEPLEAHRIDTISFGKDNNPEPCESGMNIEICWQKNRIAIVKVKSNCQ